MNRVVPVLKLLALVTVGLFVLKIGSKWLASKWPNKITQSLDTVIQAA